MAEAFAILGLTSSIMTFIEFGIRILTTVRSIRAAVDGKAPEIQELEKTLGEIHARNQRVLQRKAAGRISKDELRIADTVEECDKLADDLRMVINKLTKQATRHKFIEVSRVTIQMVVRKGELENLQKRLMEQDAKVREGLKGLLASDRHSELMKNLENISHIHDTHKIKSSADFAAIRKQILDTANKLDNKLDNSFATIEALLTSLRTKLQKLDQEAERQRKEAQVIESLYFRQIHKRRSDIDTADGDTNSWLHHPHHTSFPSWLEADDRKLFCISGLPGSGKSTLMKYAFKHPSTRAGLEKWAGSLDLCCASYFFWNQGFPLQKSQIGLLRSILYQILRHVPSLISHADPERLSNEEWEFGELKSFFDRIVLDTSHTTKFCFFIDGLDEYNGDEGEIAELIAAISQSQHIKVCASSRPRLTFDKKFQDKNLWSAEYTLLMQNFTKNDMKNYVEKTLRNSQEFRTLEITDSSCTRLMNQIAKDAKGVWLWVHLVTKDIIRAVESKEGPRKLQEIVDGFPKQLEEYFKHIIGRVNPLFRREMARSFLITIFEVQPLPLYAFYLLDEEDQDPNYAMKAGVSELPDTDVTQVGEDWKVKIRNRCSDLLTVSEGEHPVFLKQPVDFLHRTVRDFLRDWYHDDLQKELKSPFIPPISLCRIMLFFLKKQPQGELRSPKHYNLMIGLVDELLYYAREVEQHEQCRDIQVSPVEDLLDEVDRVNTSLMKRVMTNHWTHARDPPRSRGHDEYRERGNYNFIALAVQARLVKYVESKLRINPNRLSKPGRPLLDYALRPRRVTPIQLPYHSQRDEPNIDTDMVRVLLERNANPNQVVHSHNDRTVWALFLISCWESVSRGEATDTSKQAWYEVSEMLIKSGARRCCFSSDEPPEFRDVENVLVYIFGEARASNLSQQMDTQSEMSRRTWGRWVRSIFWPS